MDFGSLENAMYGDVENDEELMAELLALEAEELKAGRITDSQSTSSRASARRQHIGIDAKFSNQD